MTATSWQRTTVFTTKITTETSWLIINSTCEKYTRCIRWEGRKRSVCCWIILTYLFDNYATLWSEITRDDENCRFYFRIPSLVFFLSNDTHQSVVVWYWSFLFPVFVIRQDKTWNKSSHYLIFVLLPKVPRVLEKYNLHMKQVFQIHEDDTRRWDNNFF